MKIERLLLIIVLPVMMSSLGAPTEAGAQKRLSLENTVYGSPEANALYPYGLSAWACETTGDYVYYDESGDLLARSETGKEVKVSSFDEINELVGGEGFSLLSAVSPSEVWVSNGENVYLVDLGAQKVSATLAGPYDEVDLAPGKRCAAMVVGRDLYVVTPEKRVRINETSEEGVRYGSTVHRSEFGISKGTFWSPDGETLCFYRKDEALVGNYPMVSVKGDFAKVVPTRYPMAGRTSEVVTVGLYDVRTGRTSYLKTTAAEERYFTNISWSPDGKTIFIAEINRDQNHLWANIYDAQEGTLRKTLFEDENAKWVEPCEPATWIDGRRFVWASYRDGFRHLYLYDVDKGSCSQLTTGEWCVTQVYGYNAKEKCLLVQTNNEGYMFRNVCKLDLKGRMAQLSSPKSVSHATFGQVSSQVLVNSSAPDVAKESAFVSYKGVRSVVSTKVNPYEGYDLPEIRTVQLKSADGRHDLTGRLILPVGFDPGKRYPVVVYVYGGPHSQLVDGSWLYGASPWMLYFAQEGYVVFTMDNRGTEYRGSEAEQSVHRRLGVCEAEDQMVGVRYLQGLPFVDKSRMGVHGWSFGGFMTMNLMTAYPEVFKAGVAGGPVCDWRFYEVMYGERYMDTPEQNPEGYSATSICERIGDLRGRLLVIHDGLDSTVVIQNSLDLLNRAIEKNVMIDYAVYPNHPHNVRGADRVHLMARIKRYFDDFLK